MHTHIRTHVHTHIHTQTNTRTHTRKHTHRTMGNDFSQLHVHPSNSGDRSQPGGGLSLDALGGEEISHVF
jgi:hypothetical protein